MENFKKIPKSVLDKVVAVTRQAPSLAKSETADAGFNFVSVDQFYDQVASLAAEVGLGWATVEEGIEIINPTGNSVIVLQRFRADFFDTVTGDVAEGYFRLTIPAPFSDAQTAGISVSYFDKCLMRSVFKVVTGEKDADHFAKKRGGSAPSTKKVEVKDEDLDPGPKAENKPAAETKPSAKPKAKKPEPEPEPKQAASEATPEEAPSGASDGTQGVPPWEEPAQEGSNLEAVADRLVGLLNDISKTKAGQAGIAALDSFRNAETDSINELKAAAAVEDASEETKLQADKVRKLFAKLYDQFEQEVEGNE